jgi:exodeoxyribonuclease V alpha subunit
VHESASPIFLGIALASAAVRNGHSCVDLAELSARGLRDAEGEPVTEFELPSPAVWLQALEQSALVALGAVDPAAPRPLVMDARRRLYLTRYFSYEERLARNLKQRIAALDPGLDLPLLQHGLDRLLPREPAFSDGQRVAAAVAVLRRFCVISGGPGTGKTFTVAKVLALLQEQALARGEPPYRICLLAPTGKAAQRLGQAIQKNLAALACTEHVRALIPTAASTLHRALGFQARTPTRFRHDATNPLAYDVVIVDEASMVDLALMTKLVDAVRPDARLVLLGDKDQLASVDVGSILGDLYADAEGAYSAAFARHLHEITAAELPVATKVSGSGLEDCRVHLTQSRRFAHGSGIADLSRAVQAGQASAALSVLNASPDIELRPLDVKQGLAAALGALVVERWGKLGRVSVAQKLELLDDFRILCCHRQGPLGVETVNAWVAEHLGRSGCIDTEQAFYEGRPVLVTANDYRLELFNGDVGVVGPLPAGVAEVSEAAARLQVVHFPGAEPGSSRTVSPGRLPSHETAFAMSVHKSQGSEFGDIALILPEKPTQLVTRELVYTAITRAKRRVVIFGSSEVLSQAIESRVERASGLRARLTTPQAG